MVGSILLSSIVVVSIVVGSIVVGSILLGSIVVVGRSRSVGLGADPVASHSNLTASQCAGVPPSPSYFLFYPFLSVLVPIMVTIVVNLIKVSIPT